VTTSESPLPRELLSGIYWIGDCVQFNYKGDELHSSISVYVVTGTERSMIVDMGIPKDWPVLREHLDQLLDQGIPPIEYLFPTHPEVPHAGNVARWAARYPAAKIVGETRDYHVYFPDLEDRLFPLAPGDMIDLGGGFLFEVVPSLVRDLRATAWGYDRQRQVLFPGDGFGYMHFHAAGQCGRTAEEVDELDYKTMALTINQFALYWTYYSDPQDRIDRLREFVQSNPTKMIAPAHGLPLADPPTTMPKVLDGLRVRGLSVPGLDH